MNEYVCVSIKPYVLHVLCIVFHINSILFFLSLSFQLFEHAKIRLSSGLHKIYYESKLAQGP